MKILMSLLLAFILASCSSTKNKNEEMADLYYSMGTNSLMSKNYTVALTNLLKAKELSPKRSDINNNLGMAYLYKKDMKQAFFYIQQAIKFDPKNTDAVSNLGSLYMENKNYAKAKETYQNVLKDLTYPKQFITYYNLGKIEFEQKNLEKAKEFFKLSVDDNASACASYYYLGQIDLKLKNYTAAQDNFKNAYYGTCYGNEFPLYYHGLAFEMDGKIEVALGRYQELIDRFPSSALSAKAQTRISQIQLQDKAKQPRSEKPLATNESAPVTDITPSF
jgi:Tfp pilus assembly protein PilF